jgi:hypothetical protein
MREGTAGRWLRVLCAYAFALFLVLVPGAANAAGGSPICDTSWKASMSGFWDVASNWTNGVPTATSGACITVTSGPPYTVTVRGSTNVAASLWAPDTTGATIAVTGSTDAGGAKLTLYDQSYCDCILVLTTTDPNAAATLDVAGGTLIDTSIQVNEGAGDVGGRFLQGSLATAIYVNADMTVLGAQPWRAIGSIYIAPGKVVRADSGLLLDGGLLLGGDGRIVGDTTLLSGELLPERTDTGYGKLTIAGNYNNHGASNCPLRFCVLMIRVGGANGGQFDVLDVTHHATLGGQLSIRWCCFTPTPGQTFPILTAASTSGTFGQVTGEFPRPPQAGAVGNRGSALYLAPTYPGTGVTLEARQATLAISRSQGPAGTPIAVTGSGWTAGDTIHLRLIDSTHHQFHFSTTADDSGSFATTITAPANAATGAATMEAASRIIRGLHVKEPFTITS